MIEIDKLRSEQREKDLRFQEEIRERDRRWRQEDQEAQRKANESFQFRMKKLETRRQILITLFGSILTILGTMLLFWLGFKGR